jgi:hypothetical protein
MTTEQTDTETTATPQPAKPTVRLVYAGRRESTKGSTGYAYATLEALERGSEPDRFYSKQIGKVAQVGAIVEVEYNPDNLTSIYSATGRWVGRWTDDRVVIDRWRASDLAEEDRRTRKSLLTKVNREDPLDDVLTRLSAAAAGLTRAEKRALAARLMEALWL